MGFEVHVEQTRSRHEPTIHSLHQRTNKATQHTNLDPIRQKDSLRSAIRAELGHALQLFGHLPHTLLGDDEFVLERLDPGGEHGVVSGLLGRGLVHHGED